MLRKFRVGALLPPPRLADRLLLPLKPPATFHRTSNCLKHSDWISQNGYISLEKVSSLRVLKFLFSLQPAQFDKLWDKGTLLPDQGALQLRHLEAALPATPVGAFSAHTGHDASLSKTGTAPRSNRPVALSRWRLLKEAHKADRCHPDAHRMVQLTEDGLKHVPRIEDGTVCPNRAIAPIAKNGVLMLASVGLPLRSMQSNTAHTIAPEHILQKIARHAKPAPTRGETGELPHLNRRN